MADHDDKDLEGLFAEMRARDAERAPEFEAVLEAARRRKPVPAPRWRVYAAAAALLVASGGSWVAMRSRATPPAVDVPVWQWRSPTASLLDVPGAHLLTGMPALPGAVAPNALQLPSLNGGIR